MTAEYKEIIETIGVGIASWAIRSLVAYLRTRKGCFPQWARKYISQIDGTDVDAAISTAEKLMLDGKITKEQRIKVAAQYIRDRLKAQDISGIPDSAINLKIEHNVANQKKVK